MVTAFLMHRDNILSTTSLQGQECRNGVFTLPELACGSTFRITPPSAETPRTSTIFGFAAQNKESSREMLRRSARRSLNPVSSWLSLRLSRHRSRHEDEEVKLWNAVKAKADPPYTGDVDTELCTSIATQTSKERPGLVRDARMSIVSALDVQSASAMSMEDSVYCCQIQHASRADVPQHTIPLQVRTSPVPIPFSLPSISRAEHAESTAIPPEASPVYGLGGIQSLASAPNSQTSLNELLRQQRQLDQSIETPRLFSTETSINPPYSNSALDDKSVELTRSLSIGQRTVCSDVSLSNFPIPPRLKTPVPPLPPLSSSSIKRIRGDRRFRLAAARPIPAQDTSTLVLPKTLPSLVDNPGFPGFNSIPHTPTGEENESLSAEVGKFCHSDSGGTQYNVTSFIGGRMLAGSGDNISDVFEDLATPGESCQGSQERPWWPAENESFGSIEIGSDMKKLPPQMLLGVPRQLERPAAAKSSPLARSSRLSQENITDKPDNQTSRPLRIAPSPEIPAMSCVEEAMPRPPRRPQLLQAAGHTTLLGAEGVDRVQRTFVRRRPPPLAIQSYTERNPGISWVQVLVDD